MNKVASVEPKKSRPARLSTIAKARTPAAVPAKSAGSAPSQKRAMTPLLLEDHHNSEVHAVEFRYAHPTAHEVQLAGTFNGWQPSANPMRRQPDGNWSTELLLKPGHHEYRLVVDGHWLNDPLAESFVTNPFGGLNCVLEVKASSAAARQS